MKQIIWIVHIYRTDSCARLENIPGRNQTHAADADSKNSYSCQSKYFHRHLLPAPMKRQPDHNIQCPEDAAHIQEIVIRKQHQCYPQNQQPVSGFFLIIHKQMHQIQENSKHHDRCTKTVMLSPQHHIARKRPQQRSRKSTPFVVDPSVKQLVANDADHQQLDVRCQQHRPWNQMLRQHNHQKVYWIQILKNIRGHIHAQPYIQKIIFVSLSMKYLREQTIQRIIDIKRVCPHIGIKVRILTENETDKQKSEHPAGDQKQPQKRIRKKLFCLIFHIHSPRNSAAPPPQQEDGRALAY